LEQEELRQGMRELGLQPDEKIAAQLTMYLDLVHSWNQAQNLTAIRNRRQMLTMHLLDCLSIIPYLQGRRLLDVGSGAGLPSFPIAITCPAMDVTSIDSRRKKSSFQRHAAHKLDLSNLQVVHDRVETYRPAENFDTLVCRAFSSLSGFVSLARHLCKPAGKMLAMKGAHPEQELADLEGLEVTVLDVVPVTVPGLVADRCLVIMEPG
jgi:16S rRNA (guanine527-N7)-methyltransferase